MDQERQASFSKAETSEESENDAPDAAPVSGKKASDAPVLVETIALCYLGILLMRLPVSIGDVYRYKSVLLDTAGTCHEAKRAQVG